MTYRKYYTVSFDDGLEQDKRIIRLMKQYGIRGTFNLNSALFGRRSRLQYIGTTVIRDVPFERKDGRILKTVPHMRIPEDEIRQVYEGFEIAAHGAHHLDLKKLSEEQIREEICRDRGILQQYTDLAVTGSVLPYGSWNERVVRVLKKEGFRYMRPVHPYRKDFSFPEDGFTIYPNCSILDRDLESKLDAFLREPAEEGDQLFYVWGHGYEFEYQQKEDMWLKLEKMFERIREHDEILCCTNAEAMNAQRK